MLVMVLPCPLIKGVYYFPQVTHFTFFLFISIALKESRLVVLQHVVAYDWLLCCKRFPQGGTCSCWLYCHWHWSWRTPSKNPHSLSITYCGYKAERKCIEEQKKSNKIKKTLAYKNIKVFHSFCAIRHWLIQYWLVLIVKLIGNAFSVNSFTRWWLAVRTMYVYVYRGFCFRLVVRKVFVCNTFSS